MASVVAIPGRSLMSTNALLVVDVMMLVITVFCTVGSGDMLIA